MYAYNLGLKFRQVAAQKMAARRSGLIINFSSIAARGNPGQAAYSAAKAGVEALTAVLAKEMGLLKIRAVTVAPGFIDTPSTRRSLSEGTLKHLIQDPPPQTPGGCGGHHQNRQIRH